MLENNVLINLHTLLVNGVDKILIIKIVALVTVINRAKVHSVVAMVVVTRGVCNNGSYPDCVKAERLDVVELVGKTLEVAAPSRVGIGVVSVAVVPAVNVVAGVAVIKTGCHYKVECVLARIGAVDWVCLVGIVL